MPTGRFAPSPTGDLHVGNLRTALAAWLFARSTGSRFLLRFEDLDLATSTRDNEVRQARDLSLIGLDWDDPPVRQSERSDLYEDAIADLSNAGLTYRCWCSRREVRDAAVAPHGPPGTYPGTCRDLAAKKVSEHQESGRPAALRIRCSSTTASVVDRLHGNVSSSVDDFVLRRNDGTPAYNLAVVVDDADQGVGEVVRADDLLDSTPRHIHLQSVLDLSSPSYAHVPLVLADDGKRLAKRHGSVTLHDRSALGDDPERVIAVLAASLGIDVPELRVRPSDLITRFDPAELSLDPWVLSTDTIDTPW